MRYRIRAHSMMEVDQVSASDGATGPGRDTRQWLSYGIVNGETPPEPDCVLFDDADGNTLDEGPLVLVTLQPSGIPVICRVMSYVAGNLEGEWYPFVNGDEVLVAVPEGDERAGCVIMGRFNNGIDKWPRNVAGNDTTKNAVGFRRMRSPYLIETSSSYIIRSATTGAFLGIKDDGSVTLGGGEGGNFIIAPDAVGFQSDKAGTDVVQIDAKKHQFSVGVGAIGGAFFTDTLVIGGDNPGAMAAGTFYISTSGAPPVWHAGTLEGTANLLTALMATIGAAIAPLGPLTGPVLAAIFNPPASQALIAAALGVAAVAPLQPAVIAAIKAALLGYLPDPTGVKPGVGVPGLTFG